MMKCVTCGGSRVVYRVIDGPEHHPSLVEPGMPHRSVYSACYPCPVCQPVEPQGDLERFVFATGYKLAMKRILSLLDGCPWLTTPEMAKALRNAVGEIE